MEIRNGIKCVTYEEILDACAETMQYPFELTDILQGIAQLREQMEEGIHFVKRYPNTGKPEMLLTKEGCNYLEKAIVEVYPINVMKHGAEKLFE